MVIFREVTHTLRNLASSTVQGTQVYSDVIETTHRDVQNVTRSYLHTDRGRVGHRQKYVRSVLFCDLGNECLNLLQRTDNVGKVTQRMAHYCSATEHIQYVTFPLTCYKTHTDLNMDDVAPCHIIIIIITLSQ